MGFSSLQEIFQHVNYIYDYDHKHGIGVGFFFSSRRLHTIWPRDWSSDVCSSDLAGARESPTPWSARGARRARSIRANGRRRRTALTQTKAASNRRGAPDATAASVALALHDRVSAPHGLE